MLSTDICLERGANVVITGHSNKSVDVNALRLVRNLLADDKSTEGIHHFLPDTFEAIYSQPEIVSREHNYHPRNKEIDVAFRSTPNNQSLLPTFYRSWDPTSCPDTGISLDLPSYLNRTEERGFKTCRFEQNPYYRKKLFYCPESQRRAAFLRPFLFCNLLLQTFVVRNVPGTPLLFWHTQEAGSTFLSVSLRKLSW